MWNLKYQITNDLNGKICNIKQTRNKLFCVFNRRSVKSIYNFMLIMEIYVIWYCGFLLVPFTKSVRILNNRFIIFLDYIHHIIVLYIWSREMIIYMGSYIEVLPPKASNSLNNSYINPKRSFLEGIIFTIFLDIVVYNAIIAIFQGISRPL